MIVSTPFPSGGTAKKLIKFMLYGLFALVLQAHVVSRLPYPALRIDLLLPLMFVVAVEWSPLSGVLWAGLLGFAADNFSGEFWGLHVGSFIATVCLVNMASERFDCSNPAYQMGLVGVCALGQSVALGLFLSYVPMEAHVLTSIWIDMGVRTLLAASTAPLLILPLLRPRNTI